jgi:signal transduction histidine kinase
MSRKRQIRELNRSLLHLNDLSAPVALLDDAGLVIEPNAALCRVLGAQADHLLGQALEALLSQAAREADTSAGTAVFRLTRDGEDAWFRLDRQPLGPRTLACLVDVTAERRGLDQLRAASAVRDSLMHDAEVGTWRYDPDAELYYFSTELTQAYEDATPSVDLQTMALIQHPDDIAKDAAIRERITREGGAAEAEIRYLDPQGGGCRHLHVHFRAAEKTASGLYEMCGISQNVTSLARARDAANVNAQRLRLALNAAGAGVFEYDYASKRFWFSPELKAMVGPGLLKGELGDPVGLFHPDDRPEVARLRAAAGAARTEVVEVRLLRPGGLLWVRVYFEVERGADGEPIRGVGLVLDIEAYKRQELALNDARRAAEAATAAKSGFLASVSHEIRTPMNGIVGVLNLLKREALSAEGRELLNEALGCSDMLSQLINDVLDFSKIEAGKLDLSPVATDPVAVVEGVLNLIRPQTDAKSIYLRSRCDPGMGPAEIDPVRLRQCLFNVIGNAVKFTQAGGVEVRLAYVGKGAARRLRCEVQDTGIGVPEAARATLFDRFQQADSGTTRRFGGTGLGLAISRSLARMMGGDLDFESREGRGSTFWFEIKASPAELPDQIAEHDFSDAPLTGLRVLVVDDNRTNRIVGTKSLEALGAWAMAADSGRAAIEAVGRESFDLILMDINMPEMDGLEATRRIRALGAFAAAIPVIALTADVMDHHQHTYLAAGMNGVVPKPFSPAQLLSEIARIAGAEDEASNANPAIAG